MREFVVFFHNGNTKDIRRQKFKAENMDQANIDIRDLFNEFSSHTGIEYTLIDLIDFEDIKRLNHE